MLSASWCATSTSWPGASKRWSPVSVSSSPTFRMNCRLLTLARLDMTTAATEMRPTDLKTLVLDVVADAQWEARERNCRVDLVSDGDCEIQANPELLRSAAENVIRNAVRYTASGTAVEVSMECQHGDDGDRAIIRVSDRGPGVP